MVLLEQLYGILLESLLACVRVPVNLIEVLRLMQVLDGFGAISLELSSLNQTISRSVIVVESLAAC
jgi:hypothetical protein